MLIYMLLKVTLKPGFEQTSKQMATYSPKDFKENSPYLLELLHNTKSSVTTTLLELDISIRLVKHSEPC
jgi:hypothetical protein